MIPTDSGHRKDESYWPKIFLEKNLANQIILNILIPAKKIKKQANWSSVILKY